MNIVKRVVNTSFWNDEKVVNMFTPEDKYFYLYLLTNPHTSQLGIYKLVPKIAAFELGYSVDAVTCLLDRFENKYGMVKYSEATSEIAIGNFLLHSIVKGGKPVMDCMLTEERNVKDKSLLIYIYNILKDKNIDNATVKEYVKHLEEVYINDNDNERIVLCDSLRLREKIIAESESLPDEGEFVCSWCGNKVSALQEHHFPLPKNMGGRETVSICKKCHVKFHTLEYQNRFGVYTNSEVKNESVQKEADAMFEYLWKLYPRKLGKGSVKPSTKRKLYDIGYEQLKRCVERYKQFVVGKDEQYIMYGSTFFNSGYVDYLDENYGYVDSSPKVDGISEPKRGISGAILE